MNTFAPVRFRELKLWAALAGVDALLFAFVITIHSGGEHQIFTNLGIAAHLGLAFLAGNLLRLKDSASDREGRKTFILLVTLICSVTPVVGFLVSAYLERAVSQMKDTGDQDDDFVFGNPLETQVRGLRSPAVDLSKWVGCSLRELPEKAHQSCAGILCRSFTAGAKSLLNALSGLPTIRSRISSQAASASFVDYRDSKILQMQRAVSAFPSDLVRREQLAQLQYCDAMMEHGAGTENRESLYQAKSHFEYLLERKPEDTAIMRMLVRCNIALREFDGLERISSRLIQVSPQDSTAELLLAECYAAMGEYARVTRLVQRLELKMAYGGTSDASREFWLGGKKPSFPQKL